jgi:4-hydroxybenzoate polyprenyltransferase
VARHAPAHPRVRPASHRSRRLALLLIIGIILLIIAIAGGVIIHPLLFALAIIAIVLFFMR